MVHRRELDGEVLIFGNHGALWGNAMTWWDHDTGTVWSQPLGEAIVGPRKGARLDALPVTFTTWDAWQESHPTTQALFVPAGETGFDLEEMAIVVELAGVAVAYPIPDLRAAFVANDTVAGLEVAVVIDPSDPDRWTVFSRRLDNNTVVTLQERGGQIVDVETGSVWGPIRGFATEGPLAGDNLNLLPGFTAFPGDFDTFWPEGRVWQP